VLEESCYFKTNGQCPSQDNTVSTYSDRERELKGCGPEPASETETVLGRK
jgi:hypothetical protein